MITLFVLTFFVGLVCGANYKKALLKKQFDAGFQAGVLLYTRTTLFRIFDEPGGASVDPGCDNNPIKIKNYEYEHFNKVH